MNNFDAPPPGGMAGQTLPVVLLVEDHDANALVIGIFLEYAGYTCDVAKDGLEAFEKFCAGTFALVLMDVKIPGVSGYEATRMIRTFEQSNKKRPTPIIGLTAHATAEARMLCLESGMNDYLTKPIGLEELEQKLALYKTVAKPRDAI